MSVAITSVEGNRQLLDGGSMFGNAPRAVWERWIKPDALGRIPLACRCLLIEFDGKILLCETGIGAFFEPKLAARYGVTDPDRHVLRDNLAALGIPPERIDYVVLSHLHFDHAGGLLPTRAEIEAGDDGLIFPRAQFIVGREAWARGENPHARDRASFIPGLNQKLARSGRLILVGRDPLPAELAARTEFLITEGHTPGQLHTLFRGDRGRVFYCGDLVPGASWVHVPITMGYDRFPERLIDEKAAVYARAWPEEWLMFFTHDPVVAAAHLGRGPHDAFVPTRPRVELVRAVL
jgi:glyoxylase-like metal-dependent hydrolase (beta-lactamase superfamily II)